MDEEPSFDELELALERLESRFVMGGGALDQAPAAWRAAIGRDARPEVALLALAGQARAAAFRPRADALEPITALPRLAPTTLPERLRPHFRRLVADAKRARAPERLDDLLRLMAARGFVVHPADPAPSDLDALPSCYAPWARWRRDEATDADEAADDIGAENWALFGPIERRTRLEALRRRAPEDARALLEAHIGALAAEPRARAIEAMAVGLTEADAAFLASLASDRSTKVRALAAALLARLGQGGDSDADVAELAGFFERGRAGVFRRADIVRPRTLKTGAQRARRRELLESLSLAGFAGGLGMTPAGLIAAWPPAGDSGVDAMFVAMIARSADDRVAHAAAMRFLPSAIDAGALAPLVARLDDAARDDAIAAALSRGSEAFALALACAGDALGALSRARIERASSFRALVRDALEQDANKRDAPAQAIEQELAALALIADADAAHWLSGILDALPHGDLARGLLRFNAALRSENERLGDGR